MHAALLLLPQLGGAIYLWVRGIINCVVILILMAAMFSLVRPRTVRRWALCIGGWMAILGFVRCTGYIPYLRELVFEPIASLGWLM